MWKDLLEFPFRAAQPLVKCYRCFVSKQSPLAIPLPIAPFSFDFCLELLLPAVGSGCRISHSEVDSLRRWCNRVTVVSKDLDVWIEVHSLDEAVRIDFFADSRKSEED